MKIKQKSVVQLNDRIIKPRLIIKNCPDPAAHRIKFKLIEKTATNTGRIGITGIVMNLGHREFKNGGGVAYLYEGPTLKRSKRFSYLAPGAKLILGFTRTWYSRSAEEGEFPPTYKLVILYDAAISVSDKQGNKDCNMNNNKLSRSGASINSLL